MTVLPVGLVLAGGASRRMGQDKALLPMSGPSLPERAASRLARVCPQIALAAGGRDLVPGLPAVADGPGAGPAAGILGAAAAYPGRPLLVLACDLPEVPVHLLALIVGARDPGGSHGPAGPDWPDWIVPRWGGRLEPLCALYRPRALEALTIAVAAGILALHRLPEFAADLAVSYVDDDVLRRFGPPEQIFQNLNTPEDLARWEQSAAP